MLKLNAPAMLDNILCQHFRAHYLSATTAVVLKLYSSHYYGNLLAGVLVAAVTGILLQVVGIYIVQYQLWLLTILL